MLLIDFFSTMNMANKGAEKILLKWYCHVIIYLVTFNKLPFCIKGFPPKRILFQFSVFRILNNSTYYV